MSALFCCACTTAVVGPDMGRVMDTGPVRQPGAGSGELLHCGIMTPAPLPADDEGSLIIGTVAPTLAADVSIGGLEMTDRLIISVSILSCTITSPSSLSPAARKLVLCKQQMLQHFHITVSLQAELCRHASVLAPHGTGCSYDLAPHHK